MRISGWNIGGFKIVLLCIFISFCTACSEPQLSGDEYLVLAKDAYDIGDTRSSIIQLKNALVAAPKNLEARMLLGRIYVEIGDFTAAEKELGRVQKDMAVDPVINNLYAYVLLRQGKWSDVNVILDNIGTWSSRDKLEALAIKGQAFLGDADPQGAQAILQRAQAILDEAGLIDVRHPGVLYLRALLNIWKGENKLADESLKLIVSGKQYKAQALVLLGELSYLAEDYDSALEKFIEAKEIEYQNLGMSLNVARAYIATQKNGKAKQELEWLLKISPDWLYANFLRAYLALQEKQYEEALNYSAKVLTQQRNHLHGNFIAAVAAYALKKNEVALSHIDKVLLMRPRHSASLKLKASIELKLGSVGDGLASISSVDAARFVESDVGLLMTAGNEAYRLGRPELGQRLFDQASKFGDFSSTILLSQAKNSFSLGDFESGLKAILTQAKNTGDQKAVSYVTGVKLLSRGETEKTLKIANELNENYPDFAYGYILKGVVLAFQKDMVGAEEAFNHAIRVEPDSVVARINMAVMHVQNNRLEKARELFVQVLEKSEDHLKSLIQLYEIDKREGKDERAIVWLEKASKVHPNNPYPNKKFANQLLLRRENIKALEVVERALKFTPDDTDLLGVGGLAHQRMGQQQKAILMFTRVVELEPDNLFGHYRLAILNEELGFREETDRAVNEIMRREPGHAGAQLISARQALRRGDIADAREFLVKIESANPPDTVAEELSAQIEMAAGNPAKAAAIFQEIIKVNRGGRMVYQYAEALWHSSDKEAAIAELSSWLSEVPLDDLNRNRLSTYLLAEGQWARAEEQLRYLEQKNPKNATVKNNLAWVLYKRGDLGAAERKAIRACDLNSKNPYFKHTLAMILLDKGSAKAAEQLLDEVVLSQPNNLEFQYHLAKVKIKQEDFDSARIILNKLLEKGDADNFKFASKDDIRTLLDSM